HGRRERLGLPTGCLVPGHRTRCLAHVAPLPLEPTSRAVPMYRPQRTLILPRLEGESNLCPRRASPRRRWPHPGGNRAWPRPCPEGTIPGKAGQAAPRRREGPMRTIRWCCLLGLLALFPPHVRAADADAVAVKVVKYDELCDVVRGLRGKVVVIDFWGNTCAP